MNRKIMALEIDESSKIETFKLGGYFKSGKGWRFKLDGGYINNEKYGYLFNKPGLLLGLGELLAEPPPQAIQALVSIIAAWKLTSTEGEFNTL